MEYHRIRNSHTQGRYVLLAEPLAKNGHNIPRRSQAAYHADRRLNRERQRRPIVAAQHAVKKVVVLLCHTLLGAIGEETIPYVREVVVVRRRADTLCLNLVAVF